MNARSLGSRAHRAVAAGPGVVTAFVSIRAAVELGEALHALTHLRLDEGAVVGTRRKLAVVRHAAPVHADCLEGAVGRGDTREPTELIVTIRSRGTPCVRRAARLARPLGQLAKPIRRALPIVVAPSRRPRTTGRNANAYLAGIALCFELAKVRATVALEAELIGRAIVVDFTLGHGAHTAHAGGAGWTLCRPRARDPNALSLRTRERRLTCAVVDVGAGVAFLRCRRGTVPQPDTDEEKKRDQHPV